MSRYLSMGSQTPAAPKRPAGAALLVGVGVGVDGAVGVIVLVAVAVSGAVHVAVVVLASVVMGGAGTGRPLRPLARLGAGQSMLLAARAISRVRVADTRHNRR